MQIGLLVFIVEDQLVDMVLFLDEDLVEWKSKKQNVVARSSAEVEYGAMEKDVTELVWMKQLLRELGFPMSGPMNLWCDNQAAIYIASNPVFHERTKYIEIDCHYVRNKVKEKRYF